MFNLFALIFTFRSTFELKQTKIMNNGSPSFNKRKLVHLNIDGIKTNSNEYTRLSNQDAADYYHCSVTLNNSRFIKSYSFGSRSTHTGGALFLSSSFLISNSSNFSQNRATIGGAIYSSDCIIEIINNLFDKNIAIQDAGSIYASGLANCNSWYSITDSKFVENIAAEQGGALYLQLFGPAYLKNCLFLENKAGNSGAGAFIATFLETMQETNHY